MSAQGTSSSWWPRSSAASSQTDRRSGLRTPLALPACWTEVRLHPPPAASTAALAHS